MREIVLDTETTGLDPAEGHRIVEVGAVELFNHLPTGRTFHRYLNPDRPVPQEAIQIHGLTDDFLADKPRFSDIATDLLAFLSDARLVIHNAAFDIRFLNAEFERHGFGRLDRYEVVDTLLISRKRFPGSPVSLDALCRRFGIDNSSREKHGALLDSEILAEVYLELSGGRQPDLSEVLMSPAGRQSGRTGAGIDVPRTARQRPSRLAPCLLEDEAAAHAAFVEAMGEKALWRRFG
jgi:DNA polymerase-3 subunit epsilon